MQIWPAIDLRGGKCVRLRQGDYKQETVFDDDPVAVARRWVRQGAEGLHLVDLDGARDGKPVNHEVIGRVANTVRIPCQVGGGMRDLATITAMLRRGVQRVVIGTRALRDPKWMRDMCQWFPRQLVLGIDARDGFVATEGWLQTSAVKAVELAQSLDREPLAAIVYTDIAKDGMMAGPNVQALADMNQATDTPVIASGGVCSIRHIRRLGELELAGCIVGRALYEGTIRLPEAIAAARITDE